MRALIEEGVGVPRCEAGCTGMVVEMPVMEVLRWGSGAEVRGLTCAETTRVEGVPVRFGWGTAEGVPLGVAVPLVSG